MVVVSFFSFFETYAPVVLKRRAAKIRKETGNDRYHTASEKLNQGKSSVAILKQALTRPLRLLAFHPLIQVSSLLTGFNYGIMYVTLSTFSHLWTKQYGQSIEISGLHYIACSLGEIAGAQIGGPLMDYVYKRQVTENRSPEARIPLMYPGIVLTWGGVLMYGWTAQSHAHWTVVDLGVFIMLFGMQLDDLPCMMNPDSCCIVLTVRAMKQAANCLSHSDWIYHRRIRRAHQQCHGRAAVLQEPRRLSVSTIRSSHVR